MNTIFDILKKHIIHIFDENGRNIPFKSLNIIETKRKYSVVITPVLIIDGHELTSKQLRTYKVTYKCRCGKEKTILLHKYLHKKKLVCQSCLQDSSFEYHIIPNPNGTSIYNKHITKNNQHVKNIFVNESEEFKNSFHKSHLTENEFFNYLQFIYKINNIVIDHKNIKNIRYKIFNTNNQIKYTYKISFDCGNTFESIKTVWQKCSICNKVFKIHICNLRTKNNKIILCKACALNNYIYKIHLYDKNTGLTYQSNLEKQFIDLCKENNITILNGFIIQYIFNNKPHNYITDFYLPEFNRIIEIKDTHIWYKNDIKTGKQIAKQNAAIQFGIENGFKYNIVFSKDINDFIHALLNERDSLGVGDNSGEIKSSQKY